MGTSDQPKVKRKLFRVTTIPLSLNVLLRNQLKMLNEYYEVVGVSSPGPDLEIVKLREGIRVETLPMMREIKISKDLIALFGMVRLIYKEKPYIIHANTPKASLISMIAGFWAGVPLRIYTITGLRFETESGLKRKILILMEKVTCFFSTHVIAESAGVKKLIEMNGLTSKKAFIIGNGNINGIDINYWKRVHNLSSLQKLKSDLGINDTDFVFVFVGRLVRDKGINELINAFAGIQNSNLKLLLVGPFEHNLDPLSKETLESIENNPQIISIGFQEDVRSYLNISHALVLPSYREGFPNVLLQAASMELPLISTDVNGAEEVIQEGENGYIVPKYSIIELKNAMIKMIKNYDKFDKQKCRDHVAHLFSQSNYYPLLLNFYREISNV